MLLIYYVGCGLSEMLFLKNVYRRDSFTIVFLCKCGKREDLNKTAKKTTTTIPKKTCIFTTIEAGSAASACEKLDSSVFKNEIQTVKNIIHTYMRLHSSICVVLYE